MVAITLRVQRPTGRTNNNMAIRPAKLTASDLLRKIMEFKALQQAQLLNLHRRVLRARILELKVVRLPPKWRQAMDRCPTDPGHTVSLQHHNLQILAATCQVWALVAAPSTLLHHSKAKRIPAMEHLQLLLPRVAPSTASRADFEGSEIDGLEQSLGRTSLD